MKLFFPVDQNRLADSPIPGNSSSSQLPCSSFSATLTAVDYEDEGEDVDEALATETAAAASGDSAPTATTGTSATTTAGTTETRTIATAGSAAATPTTSVGNTGNDNSYNPSDSCLVRMGAKELNREMQGLSEIQKTQLRKRRRRLKKRG